MNGPSGLDGLPVYLDYQATTPVDPRVVDVMLPYLTDQFGNPSSGHAYGRAAAEAVDAARHQLASLVGARTDEEIVFTGSATESNHLAITGTAMMLRDRGYGSHLVTTAIEHKSVLSTCHQLACAGFTVTQVPVNGDGLVDPTDIEGAITSKTILVSVMHANNEIGTLQPLREIGAITRKRGIAFHVDAAQAPATAALDVDDIGVDRVSLSAHKLYGPKGVGALYVRRAPGRTRGDVSLAAQVVGGGQEQGLRAGTLNVAGIVGFGHAAKLAAEHRAADATRALALRDRLHQRLAVGIQDLTVNGSLTHRLPGNLSTSIPGLDALDLLAKVPDLAVSTGSACATGDPAPSHVLTAIGLTPRQARGTIRISIGRPTRERDIDFTAARLIDAVAQLRDGDGQAQSLATVR